MKFDRIQICNFRSINEETVYFSHNCMVLLGKNDAGKSNVLKAIAAIFGEYKVSDKDKRKKIRNEKIESYFVRGVIQLSAEDISAIELRFLNKFAGTERILFKNGITLNHYIGLMFNEIILQVQVGTGETPFIGYWIRDDYELRKPLYLVGTNIDVSGTNEFKLHDELFLVIKAMYDEKPFRCHYWQYSENYLLPNSVSIPAFIATPTSCKPLENIFQLSGRENIKDEFISAKAQDGDYANLLEQVSENVTNTFQKIWRDFKGTSIQLIPNGEEILIKVVDRVKYTFEDRSDGFKKFISILLMLSTQARSNKIIEHDIILIDEPDQSLYPTSAQYLRDELVEISKKSNVVYSTHSQYMIDSDCLDRHIVVEKIDSITTLKVESAHAPYTTDELLRRAIGSSIFECLRPKNIIFEGYLDRELFNKYCKFHKKERDFADYGHVYLSGILGVETLTQVLSLANKKFIIVADSDQTSKNKKEDFEKNYPDFKGSWLGYQDVVETVETMEDFISIEHIQSQLAEHGFKDYEFDEKKTAIKNIEKALGNDKERKQSVKNAVVKHLAKGQINEDYGLFIGKLKETIEGL